jgi:hypothetical protein
VVERVAARLVRAAAQRLGSPRHWRMLAEVARLLAVGRRDLGSDRTRRATLDAWLHDRGVVADVRDRFVVPLAAALWSMAPARCGQFPAETYLRFLNHHGMLRADPPAPVAHRDRRQRGATSTRSWPAAASRSPPAPRSPRSTATIAARRWWSAAASTGSPGWCWRPRRRGRWRCLAAPTADERRLLGPLATSENRTVLHGDVGVMPRAPRRVGVVELRRRRRAGAHHLLDEPAAGPAHRAAVPGDAQPRPAAGAGPPRVTFEHPQFDFAALDAHAGLPRLQGAARTYFAGAWTGFGFHEDGLRSGQVAAARLLADEGA